MAEVTHKIELNLIDRELHDVISSKFAYLMVHNLHGYATALSRENAIQALGNRQVSVRVV